MILNDTRLPEIDPSTILAIDVETGGLRWWLKEEGLFGIAITTLTRGEKESFYYDIRKTPWVIDWLNDHVNTSERIVNQNIKFDAHMLLSAGIELDLYKCECTVIRAALIDEYLNERRFPDKTFCSYHLDDLARLYLGKRKQNDIYPELAKLFGGRPTREAQILNLQHAPFELVEGYAVKDSELALELWEWQEAEIDRQGIRSIVDFEHRLFPVIFDMERRGVRVDVPRAEQAMVELTQVIDETQKKLNNLAGFEVNPNPSGSIHKLFNPKKDDQGIFIACDGTPLPQTGAGKASIGSKQLEIMTHPAAELILSCRKLMKCRDTFLRNHILGHQYEGLLHPSINQTKTDDDSGVGGGRLSYTGPALQQIPANDFKVASIIRPIFIPDAGQYWGCWDYSQFEFRMFVHYSKDEKLLAQYRANPDTDFHQMVADMTGLPRKAPSSGGANAKTVNLGLLYGMGGGKLAKDMKLPVKTVYHLIPPSGRWMGPFENIQDVYRVQGELAQEGKMCSVKELLVPGEEAQRVLDQYHRAFPGIKALNNAAKAQAEARGYVHTLLDRRARFPDGIEKAAKRKAMCRIIQGSSADCLKQKMIEVHTLLKGTEHRLVLSVHDELNISLAYPDKEIEAAITHCLETYDGKVAPYLRVPIRTDYGRGANWAEASGKGSK